MSNVNTEKSEQVPIIFDTDMDADCDDAGALAVLHALMDLEEAEILGIVVDVPLEASARCVMTINDYYGRLNIPVGLLKDETFEKGTKYQLYRQSRQWLMKIRNLYTQVVVEQFSNDSIENQKIMKAVSLYRYLLSKAENHSVVIVAVGLLTALSCLLESRPDDFSHLNGEDLVKMKVKKLITMGMGIYPESRAEFNWLMDWGSAQRVINHWPTPLVVQPHGSEFQTGNKLSIKTPESNPVRKIYETYLKSPKKGNFSWDLITALYGVRGPEPYLEEVKGYRLILETELGKNHWVPDEINGYNHSFLQLRSPKIRLKKALEDLITKPPKFIE